MGCRWVPQFAEDSYVSQCSMDLEEALRGVFGDDEMPRIVTVPTEAEDAAKTLGFDVGGRSGRDGDGGKNTTQPIGSVCMVYMLT